jgi:hypothetical protein
MDGTPEVLMLALSLLLAPLACAAGPCDLSSADSVHTALKRANPDQRPMLAAAWLAEACEFPASLEAGLTEVAQVPPEMQELVAMRAVASDPALIVASCTGGPRALAQVAALAPADKRAHLFDACGLKRHAAVDRATFVGASGGVPMLYVAAAQAIAPAAGAPVVREALRALAGVPASR